MYENSKLPLPDHSQTKNGHVTQEIETNRIKLKTRFCLWIIPINALWISLTFFSKERWYNYLYHGIFFSLFNFGYYYFFPKKSGKVIMIPSYFHIRLA